MCVIAVKGQPCRACAARSRPCTFLDPPTARVRKPKTEGDAVGTGTSSPRLPEGALPTQVSRAHAYSRILLTLRVQADSAQSVRPVHTVRQQSADAVSTGISTLLVHRRPLANSRGSPTSPSTARLDQRRASLNNERRRRAQLCQQSRVLFAIVLEGAVTFVGLAWRRRVSTGLVRRCLSSTFCAGTDSHVRYCGPGEFAGLARRVCSPSA